MAFDSKSVAIQLEVRATPGAFLEASPSSVVVDKGDLATYVVKGTPLAGFAGPIFLRMAGLAGAHAFSINPLPPGGGSSILTIDTAGFPVGKYDLAVEPWDVLPAGELPVGPDGLEI